MAVFKSGKTKAKCENCGEEFIMIQPNQIYCDQACKQQAYRKRHPKNDLSQKN